MAKTKGLKSACQKSSDPGKASKSLHKKGSSSKAAKSKASNLKKPPHNVRRSSLRNPHGRFPPPSPGPSSPMNVSSESDEFESAPSSSPVKNSVPSSDAYPTPETSNPSDPTAAPVPSGNFLPGRSSLFDSCFSRRPVHLERQIDFSNFPPDFLFIQTIFESRGWGRLGSIHGSASVVLVREFYTNFHCVSMDLGCFDTLVRGHHIHITIDDLASFLQISRTTNPGYPNVDWSACPPLSDLVLPMRDNPNRWFPGMIFRQSDLSVPYRIFNLICDSLLTPNTRSSEVTEEKIKFLHCLTQGISIDLPSLIFNSMVSAHNAKNSRLCLPYGILVTNLLRDQFNIVKRLHETSAMPDPPISRATIRRTIAQKHPVSSLPTGVSPSPAPFSSGTQPASSSIGSVSSGDPMSVVIFTLTSFTERLTRLERVIHDSQIATDSRIQKLEETVQTHIETIQMNLLEPLQAAAQSASSVASRMETIESSVRALVNPAQEALTAVTDEVKKLATDLGDLNRTFAAIEQHGRQRSRR